MSIADFVKAITEPAKTAKRPSTRKSAYEHPRADMINAYLSDGKPRSTVDIATQFGLTINNARNCLERMRKRGEVSKLGKIAQKRHETLVWVKK